MGVELLPTSMTRSNDADSSGSGRHGGSARNDGRRSQYHHPDEEMGDDALLAAEEEEEDIFDLDLAGEMEMTDEQEQEFHHYLDDHDEHEQELAEHGGGRLASRRDSDHGVGSPRGPGPRPPLWRRPFFRSGLGILFLFALILILVFSGSQQSEIAEGPPIPQPLMIEKSASDPRSYRFIQLEKNSLPVLLIQDSNTAHAAASMSVAVGSASDPADRQGLAHFLEHMLFLGSENYPEEGTYNAMLAQRGGRSNAYTAEEETNYYFEVQAGRQSDANTDTSTGAESSSSSSNLASMLPVFAGFFTNPLLAPSGVSREMQAVHNEHAKNLLNDDWRQWQLLHTLTRKQSAFNHFGTGSIASLNHSSIVSNLTSFYTTHYTASRMKLVVLGSESLDELESLVVQHFSDVPGPTLPPPRTMTICQGEDESEATQPGPGGVNYVRQRTITQNEASRHATLQHDGTRLSRECVTVTASNGAAPLVPTAPFAPSAEDAAPGINHALPFLYGNNTGRMVTWIPIAAPSYDLHIYFPLPNNKWPFDTQMRTDPIGYITYILGHEGSAWTFCSMLKRLGWAKSVGVGVEVESSMVDQTVLAVTIRLTEEGNSEENRRRILTRLFEYVALMKAQSYERPPSGSGGEESPSTHERLWKNWVAESMVRFRFKEKEAPIDYTSTLASRMTQYQPFGLSISAILFPPKLMRAYTGSAIHDALSLMTPKNCLIFWSSSTLQDDTVKQAIAPDYEWMHEEWYDILYLDRPIDPSLVSELDEAMVTVSGDPESATDMKLPPESNVWIPTDVDVVDFAGAIAAAKAEMEQQQGEGSETDSDGQAATPASDALHELIGPSFDPDLDLPVEVALDADDEPQDATPSPLASRLFYRPDIGHFSLPYAWYACFFRFPAGFMVAHAEPQVSFQLYLRALDEIMNDLKYQASQLGYGIDVTMQTGKVGFSVRVSGFSSMLLQLWKQVLAAITNLQGSTLTDERLSVLKKSVLADSYESFATAIQPYNHALYFLRLYEERHKLSMDVLESSLRSLPDAGGVQHLQSFVDAIFNGPLATTSYAYGNINISHAKQFHRAMLDNMRKERDPPYAFGLMTDEEMKAADVEAQEEVYRMVGVPDASTPDSSANMSYVFKTSVLNPQEQNSAMLFNLQIHNASSDPIIMKQSIMLKLIESMISNEAFQQLRTVEQLGYLVWSFIRESSGGYGESGLVRSFIFLIQNPTTSPLFLEARVDNFIQLFLNQTLQPLTDELLNTHKASLRLTLQQQQHPPTNMADNFAAVWKNKIERGIDLQTFDREKQEMDTLQTITKEELMKFYMEKFCDPSTRIKFVSLVYGSAYDPASTTLPDSTESSLVELIQRDVDVGSLDVSIRDSLRQGWKAWSASGQ